VFLADHTAEPYSFRSCHADNATVGPSNLELNDTVWGTSGNKFLVLPDVQVTVPCKSTGGSSIPLKRWQDEYKQEHGGSVGPMPSVKELRAMAEGVLR
jgi:hypothetical protein